MSGTKTARALEALRDVGALDAELEAHVSASAEGAQAVVAAQLVDRGILDPPADDDAVLAALGLGPMPADVAPLDRDFLGMLVHSPVGDPVPRPQPAEVESPADAAPADAAPAAPMDAAPAEPPVELPAEPLPFGARPSALSRPMAMIPPDEMVDPPLVAAPLAPVAVPTRRSWAGWIAGAGVVAAALLAFVVMRPLLFSDDGVIGDAPVAASDSPAKRSVGGPAEAEKAAAEQGALEKAAIEKLAAEKAAERLAAEAAAKAAEEGAGGDNGAGEDGVGGDDGAGEKVAAAKPKASRRARRSSAKPAAARPAAPKPAARAPAARKPAAKKESTSEVDDLLGALDGSGGGSKSRAASPAAASPAPSGGDPLLPEKLTRRQILTVVKRNARTITACKGDSGASGTVPVELVIGRAGRVTSAKVKSGPQKGTEVGACIERKVRAFRFPAFAGDPMRIVMPFAL